MLRILTRDQSPISPSSTNESDKEDHETRIRELVRFNLTRKIDNLRSTLVELRGRSRNWMCLSKQQKYNKSSGGVGWGSSILGCKWAWCHHRCYPDSSRGRIDPSQAANHVFRHRQSSVNQRLCFHGRSKELMRKSVRNCSCCVCVCVCVCPALFVWAHCRRSPPIHTELF